MEDSMKSLAEAMKRNEAEQERKRYAARANHDADFRRRFASVYGPKPKDETRQETPPDGENPASKPPKGKKRANTRRSTRKR